MGDYDPNEHVTPSFDVELLGLQHELLGHLQENGIVWFEDFDRIEADLGNGELKVYLTCEWERVEKLLRTFARENGFTRVYHVPEKNAVYMKRR